MKRWILVLALLGSGAVVAPAAAQEPAPAAEKVAEKVLGDLLTLTGKTGFSLGLGGFANLGYLGAIIDESEVKVSARLARDTFLHDAEFHFTAKQKLDQWGLEVGYHLDLEAAKPDDIIDEHYGYIKHKTFGEIIVGAKNDAAHQLQVHAPTFAAGIKFHANAFAYLEDAHHYTDGDLRGALAKAADSKLDFPQNSRREAEIIPTPEYDNLFRKGCAFDYHGNRVNDRVNGKAEECTATLKSPSLAQLDDGLYETRHSKSIINDVVKLTYKTPRLGGVQFGISYIPSDENPNGGGGRILRAANVTHAVGYGLNYKGEVGKAKLAASFGHVINPDDKGEIPFHEISVGVQGSVGPVAVGGSWILREDWKNIDGVDAHVIYVSASYKFLQHYIVGLGFNYATVSEIDGEDTTLTGSGHNPPTATISADDTLGIGQVYQSVQLGMTRKLAPGVSVGGFYQWSHQDFKSPYYNDSQHHFVGLMTGLKF